MPHSHLSRSGNSSVIHSAGAGAGVLAWLRGELRQFIDVALWNHP
jgi:hypothetical protein